MNWLFDLLSALPPPVGFLITGSFPIVAIAAGAGAIRAAWFHQRDRAALLGAVAMVAFGAALAWSGIAAAGQ